MLVERNGIEMAVDNKNDCAGGVCSYSDCGAAATTTIQCEAITLWVDYSYGVGDWRWALTTLEVSGH